MCEGTIADTVLRNGKIFTIDPGQPWVEAVGIAGDRFCFVGSNDEARQIIGAGARILDLNGAFVMPGFNDAHIHFRASMLPALCEFGITTAQTISDPNDVPDYVRLAGDGQLTTRLEVRLPIETWRDYPKYKTIANETNGMVNVNGLKGYVDGVFRNRSAFLLAPYRNAPFQCGSLSKTAADAVLFDQLLSGALSVGADISVHAIGDAGVRALLGHYKGLTNSNPNGWLRLRVAHASLVSPADFPKFGELKLIAEVNPYHATAVPWLRTIIGGERVRWAFPFRSLKAHGALLCFSSDHPGPIEGNEFPLNPFLGIQAAVLHENPEQRVSLKEALEAYTIAPAIASRQDGNKGNIEVGRLADLIVLCANPFAIPSGQIRSIRVAMTIVGGKEVYRER